MLERHKIYMEAVKQAERLAAIHDPSGKMFNVGEVLVMPDGQVKSKETLRRTEEAKAKKSLELAAEREAKRIAEEEKMKIKDAKRAARAAGLASVPVGDANGDAPKVEVPGVNLQRAALFYTQPDEQQHQIGQPGAPGPRKISKSQLKRQEML